MISIFWRLLDDPQLLSYAYGKVKPGGKPSVRSILRHYWDLFFYDLGFEKVKKKINNYSLDFLKFKTAEETFTALINSCSDFDEAAEMHIESSESSSEWNMTLLQILSEAKRNDFATLLGTSSNVESAAIPQMIQDISCQIVKDLGNERFRCFSVELGPHGRKPNIGYKRQKLFLDIISENSLKKTWPQMFEGVRCPISYMGYETKLLVKLLQNLAVSTKKEIKKESDSINKIFSQLHITLNFTSRVREAGKSLTIKSFDHWRKGYRRLGKLMVSEGRLPDQDLIFFLTLDEIDDLLKTRSPCIISRARSRRKLFPIVDEYKFPEIMRGVPKPVNDDDKSADMQ
ncbi:phosphoenolpyruvate synthase [Caerostris extrusa]|uniref:Phosphoenolpyruvate synthase n=1 Tax=Caerostris extrusa TaxID=172846 RepID=A0AAV4SBM6_CAEEX|nr:phosphoenolpyruvate synthase [Caerostris extrusa]